MRELSLFSELAYDTHVISALFRKSEKTQGVLYYLQAPSENGRLMWKYGKTKNLFLRLSLYNTEYKLIEHWKCNHHSLREYLIHNHSIIKQCRKRNGVNGKYEHIYQDCFDLINEIATAEIWHDITTNQIHGGNIHCGNMVIEGDDLIKLAKFI